MLLSPRKGVAMLAGLASWFCAFSIISCQTQQRQASWTSQKSSHQASSMNADQVRYLASLSNMQSFDAILDPILVPRPVGSQNHEIVKEYIRSQMQSSGWDVMFDSFTDNTPFGAKNFTNIVATLDPRAKRRLVLACHYDSKYSREGVFVGATDSAVPCAMLISLAKDMAKELDQLKARGNDVTLQLLFFDGEEAFRDWTATDSIYGARHLAQRWASEPYPSNTRDGTRELHRMDMMVLLDLLGAPSPRFFNYFQATDRWYKQMKSAEQRLKKAGYLRNHYQSYFREGFTYGGIEDDHKPFLERGVPILHLITSPFPSVWHTNADNKAALDYPTIDNLNKIVRVFVAEYLGLQA